MKAKGRADMEVKGRLSIRTVHREVIFYHVYLQVTYKVEEQSDTNLKTYFFRYRVLC